MKINFTLWGAGCCGGNRTIFELANGLSRRGYEVSITSLTVNGNHRWFGKVDADFVYVGLDSKQKFVRKHLLGDNDIDWMGLLAANILDCDVNVATYNKTAYPVLWSGKGKPVYLIQHDESTFYNDCLDRNTALLSYCLPLKKLVVSDWLQQKFGGINIGNGVNLNKFKDLGLRRVYDIMLFNRNIQWKGNVHKIAKTLRENGDKVLLVENFSEKQLVEAYNQSKFVVFPSEQKEGFGLIPLEAMACRCVVITSPCTEFCVDGVNSFVTTDFKQKLDEIYLNGFDTQILKNGENTAHEFDFSLVVDRFEKAVCK
jgi:hypothetical protein